jgi:aspartyl-tRNA(Asn)/glutamyl-tRNA(Gln) amidotransferase subunit A
MGVDDLVERSAVDLAELIVTRQISPVELTKAYLDRSHRLARLNAYVVTLDEEGALAAERDAEREITRGRGLVRCTACRLP